MNFSKVTEKLVHRKLYGFLEFNNYLHTNEFGFRNLQSTNHALISITEKIRKAIDDGEITCVVFLDLQKAFDTVNHEIFLSKLEHYGIRGVPLKWFKTFLTHQHQYVSIENSISETPTNNHWVPQGSVLGPRLFLIHINDLHQATKHAKIHYFADDTNLLYSSKFLKDINQKINFELKNIIHWLRANKISLNTKKMEVVLFRAQKAIIKKTMNFRITGQKVNIMKEKKYLGMIMDEHLTFKNHMDTVKLKLNRANGLLAKLRHYVNPALLRTVYYAIFEHYLRYRCQLWGQAQTQVLQNIEKIQNKALRILNFKNPWEPIEQIYKESKIFKLKYLVTISNLKFVYDQMNKILRRVFEKKLSKKPDNIFIIQEETLLMFHK